MQWNPHQADFGVEKGRLYAAEARVCDVSPKVRMVLLAFVCLLDHEELKS